MPARTCSHYQCLCHGRGTHRQPRHSPRRCNNLLLAASQQRLKGVLGYTEAPMASVDFNHDPRSGILDATQTRVAGKRLIKLLCWFDNEWGFANRMLDISQRLARLSTET
ncbi:hypothetical protein [Halomonas sp. PA16-9]|uniref:hypothetical protein n=1 Tax=Halomonas sp. PA16-9 TaxID=2576841 RepID=UPI0030EDEFB8